MPESELDRLDPQPAVVKLKSGFEMEIQRLKTRQMFRLLKVLTHGAGPLVQQQLDFGDTAEDFGRKLLALVVISMPDAENEFIDFLVSMTKPVGLIEGKGRKLNKQEQEDNQVLWRRYEEELGNPEPMDLLDMAEVIVAQEAPELQALGKRIAALMGTFRKSGAAEQTSTPPGPQELAEMGTSSPETSPEPSTS
jgi:hypothetical protein